MMTETDVRAAPLAAHPARARRPPRSRAGPPRPGDGPRRRRQDRLPGRHRHRRPALRAERAPHLPPLHGGEGPRLVRRPPEGDAAAREEARARRRDPARDRAPAPHPHLRGPVLLGRASCARRSSCCARPWRSCRRSSSSTSPRWRGSSGRRSRSSGASPRELGAELWMACRTHREGPPTLPGHLPPPADRFEDLVDLGVPPRLPRHPGPAPHRSRTAQEMLDRT